MAKEKKKKKKHQLFSPSRMQGEPGDVYSSPCPVKRPALGLFLQLRKRLLRAALFTAVMSSMDQVWDGTGTTGDVGTAKGVPTTL